MEIRTRHMKAVFDEKRAAFVSIQGTEDPSDTEFLLRPEEFPEYDVAQARWLGNLYVEAVQAQERRRMDTGLLAQERKLEVTQDRICVRYPGKEPREDSIQGLFAEEQYRIREEGIFWDIRLRNETKEPLCMKKLGIYLFMNQYFRNDDFFKYEKCVLRHSCIAHHHSWIYWEKSSGNMPMLYLTALGDTPLDHFGRETDGVFGPAWKKGAFEGSYLVYPVHEPTDKSQLETQELVLEAGAERTFSFFLGMAESFTEMQEQQVALGGLTVRALPGMCAPVGTDLFLLIKSSTMPEVRLLQPQDRVLSLEQKKGYYVVKLRLGGCGVRLAEVRQKDTCMRLQLFGLEKPGDILEKQAAFIAEKQFETDPEDPCFHGILMWDMTQKRRVNASFNPCGDNWFAGGSDEIGLVSGLYLAGKNVWQPKREQIWVLQKYVKDFVRKRLTEQPGYKVHRMVPWFEMFEPWAGYGADDVWRAFNYVHVINTLYHMYQIAKRYRYDFLDEPVFYLKEAYAYAQAMFSYWMFPNGVGASEFGNMGELHLALDLPEALAREGLLTEAALLRGIIQKKAAFFAAKSYPYGSEMAYDSTAFEAVYAYGKAGKDRRVMELTQAVSAANRGRQPVWYLYQTDLRQHGDSAWNVSYMTQLGAFPLYDWAFWEDGFTEELAESWYASYLAGFSIYNSGGFWSAEKENEGAAGWIVDGYMGRFCGEAGHTVYSRGLVARSGEGALGFYGALQIAAAAVIDHSVLGRMGLGCRVEQNGAGECIYPEDGLGVRLHHIPAGWTVCVNRDRMQKAVWDGSQLSLELKNLTEDAHVTEVTWQIGGTTRNVLCRVQGPEAKLVLSAR